MGCNEVSLEGAWELLASTSNAALVDVRTEAEWNFVGVPDLTSLGKELQRIEWNRYPGGVPNEDFTDQVSERLATDQPVLLLCRSGVRSLAAAAVLESAGFKKLYNVTDGFEGGLDDSGHRQGGWKGSLPWVQT
jgi:rhodanese-related sulfurtransferase